MKGQGFPYIEKYSQAGKEEIVWVPEHQDSTQSSSCPKGVRKARTATTKGGIKEDRKRDRLIKIPEPHTWYGSNRKHHRIEPLRFYSTCELMS